MNLADIRAWLASSQDFAQGRALYTQLGTSKTYQSLFALGETDYSSRVLLRELSGLGQQVAAVASLEPLSPLPAPPVPAPEPPSPLPAVSADESPLLAALYEQLRGVRDERSHRHPQLTAKGTGQKRRQALAGRIVALTKQEVELKVLVAHVRQHARLPGPVATAEVTDQSELRRRLLNARSQRSRLKKLPERAADLAAIEAEIILIQSKLIP